MEKKTCVNCRFFYNTVCNHHCEPSLGDDNKCFWFEDKYDLPIKQLKLDMRFAKLYSAIAAVKRGRTKIKNKLTAAINHCEYLRLRNAELEAEIERLEKYIDALHKQG